MIIYKITNKLNNKCYVGLTTYSFNRRYRNKDWWTSSSINSLLKASINKYGIQNFVVEIVGSAENKEELCKLEQYYIQKFNSVAPNGYNLTSGGENYKHSELSNFKNRMAHLGKPSPMKGKKWPKEFGEKISFANKGKPSWNKGKKTGRPSESAILNSALAHKKPIYGVCLYSGFVKEYDGLIDAERDGFRSSIISLCCKYPNKYRTHKNHVWMYK